MENWSNGMIPDTDINFPVNKSACLQQAGMKTSEISGERSSGVLVV
jgi:hypothetical protein